MSNTIDTFNFCLNGMLIERNCHFVPLKYFNGNNALCIENNDGEKVCICSVNTSQKKTNTVLSVKDWSENDGMVEFLVMQGIINSESDNRFDEQSGFVTIRSYPLTEKGKELFAKVA